eukprot:TRINITY_DN7896_c0_g1_i1.p1 TRINITY_DN7896_c0_g1~~TRINITY_DN7896_c0_g1_i1.p1  ORF type:complete len:147 (+),score=17.87 TRINITY_DN7896_c0_g1_i1:220-660(+)
MSNVDVYMFPCYSCGGPAGQVQKLNTFLQSNGIKYGRVWFDIEGAGTYWSGSTVANANFFNSMAAEGSDLGWNMGVYANWNSWPQIMGSLSKWSNLPIWYPDYDGIPNFDDFQAFDGWTSPAMKQFSSSGSKCSSSYDINWYPPGK